VETVKTKTFDFTPLNNLEKSLIEAKHGEITLPRLIDILLQEKFFMPSINLVDENGAGFLPLLFDRDGISMASIFTDKSRVKIHESKIKDIVIMSFKDILNNIPENYGLVINPGYTEGLELLPRGIKNVRRDFLSKNN
jgi:hypothetical protein